MLYPRGWPGASYRHCWLVVELLFALVVRRVPGPCCLGVSGVAQGLVGALGLLCAGCTGRSIAHQRLVVRCCRAGR